MKSSQAGFGVGGTLLVLLLCCVSASLGVKPPLHTSGSKIVDSTGDDIILGCVSWYGAEEYDYVVAGLQSAPLSDIASLVKQYGFNCVRLLWSNEMVETNPTITNSTVLAANLDLLGLTALEVFDQTIAALVDQGIMVILDNHVSSAAWCCSTTDGNGLWFTESYSLSDWHNDWITMVKRYADNPYVIGADLRNELREMCDNSGGNCSNANWGNGDIYDWKIASTYMGNSLLNINPNLLIIIEGLNYATTGYMWQSDPVTLNVSNQLVYSVHDYSWDIGDQASCDGYFAWWNISWGYLVQNPSEDYAAPLWIGEFGTCHDLNQSCVTGPPNTQGFWFTCLLEYIKTWGIHWSYWPLNGCHARCAQYYLGEEEDYGVLNLYWNDTANPKLLQALQSIQQQPQE